MERSNKGIQTEAAAYEALVTAGISIVVNTRHSELDVLAKSVTAYILSDRLQRDFRSEKQGEIAGIGMKQILEML